MTHGSVVGFYDSHPLNEEQILQSLARRGKDPYGVTPEDLFEFDQDHYGGVEAVAVLAERASISQSSVVLDLCSGLGGPARYLAWRYGCTVVGIDITASRVDGATRLTMIAGLSDQVRFVHADATELPFAAESFTASISQEAFVHISDKTRLLSECRRVLRPRGVLAFTDWTAASRLSPGERQRLERAFAADGLVTGDEYGRALERAGFTDVSIEDLTPEWAAILPARLEMYRSLRAETVARFGQEHYDEYHRNYALFVQLVEARKLGGCRFCAIR
jgi:sarcosine/dimethylglycine N-methyltransferase